MTRASGPPPPLALFAAVTLSGAAGLTWEVLWQHHATLLAYGKDRFERYHRGAQWGHRMLEANMAAVRAAAEPDRR